jgi:molybdate transport system substrate-binding protein
MSAPRLPSNRRLLLLLLPLALGSSAWACAERADTVLVLAAASTIDAMEAAVADFGVDTSTHVEVSFGPTSVLARQLEEGAPADLMLSASVGWADYVEARVPVDRRVALARNELRVVVPSGAATAALSLQQIAAEADLGRIAVADPTSVPAGIYAAQALRRAGLWEAVEPRLIPALDVRAALTLVADGEVDAAFVYATDAAASARVRVVARIDPSLHDVIEYPLLLLGGARPEAVRFFDFLTSARGRAHFHERGFIDAGR